MHIREARSISSAGNHVGSMSAEAGRPPKCDCTREWRMRQCDCIFSEKAAHWSRAALDSFSGDSNYVSRRWSSLAAAMVRVLMAHGSRIVPPEIATQLKETVHLQKMLNKLFLNKFYT